MRKYIFQYLFSENRVVFLLITSEFVAQSAWGLFAPIAAIYVTDYIPGADIKVAGLAISIGLLTQSLVQLPFAKFIDSKKGEVDDLLCVVIGYFLANLAIIAYVFAHSPIHIYLIQFVWGIGLAIAYPGWMGIFTRHVTKGKEGFQWTLYSTLINGISALAATLGAVIAFRYGFETLIWVAGLGSMFGTSLLLLLYPQIKQFDDQVKKENYATTNVESGI